MQKYRYLILLSFIIVILFGRTCFFGFINFDDDVNVFRNQYLSNVTLKNTLLFWKKPYEQLYIPFTYTLWALQVKVSQVLSSDKYNLNLKPYVFHATNVLFHILASILVFLILKILIGEEFPAFIGSLLFALHPMQVEPVAWVTGFKDVLCGFLSIYSLYLYILFIKTEKKKRFAFYFISVVFFILAILSKPSGIVIPAILFIISYFMLKRNLTVSVSEAIPFIIFALPVMIFTGNLQQPAVAGLDFTTIIGRFLVAGDTMTFYLYKLVFPYTLIFLDYGRTPKYLLAHNWVFVTAAISYIFIIFCLAAFRKKMFFYCLCIFLVSLLPVLGFMIFRMQYISTVTDRYLYTAMLGPSLYLGWLLSKNRKLTNIIVVVLVLLGIKAFVQVGYWKDSFTLFNHNLKVRPDSWLTHSLLGNIYYDQGKINESIDHLVKSIHYKSDYPFSYYTLGLAYEKAGDLDRAVYNLKEAIRYNQYEEDNLLIYNSLGTALSYKGEFDSAIEYVKKALSIQPDYAFAYNSMGYMYILKHKKSHDNRDYYTAIEYLNKAIEIAPNFIEAYNNLAICYTNLSEWDKAIDTYSKCLKLNPNFALAHFNMGFVYHKQKKTDEAINQLKLAIYSDPGYAKAYYNLGIMYQEQGRISEAADNYRKALQITPSMTEASKKLSLLSSH